MVLKYCMERDLLGLSLLSPAYEGKTYQVAINYPIACELSHFYSSARLLFLKPRIHKHAADDKQSSSSPKKSWKLQKMSFPCQGFLQICPWADSDDIYQPCPGCFSLHGPQFFHPWDAEPADGVGVGAAVPFGPGSHCSCAHSLSVVLGGTL